MATDTRTSSAADQIMTLTGAPEKHLLRAVGSVRHLHYHLAVKQTLVQREREPVCLALVIDRSGSMSGPKIEMAKHAALAVLDRLDDRDTASITVFDTAVDTILPAGPVTAEHRDRARRELDGIQARASTALHQGWFTGCHSIPPSSPHESRLARCFLLTDGLANHGETDPERIAQEAADIRNNAGIGTSTFGIGTDYDEGLLGPMAVAGGGQFHHLQNEGEMAATFSGELGELMQVAAKRARLEIVVEGSAALDVVTDYWCVNAPDGRTAVDVGHLMAGEERHVVVRVRTGPQAVDARVTARARLTWTAHEKDWETQWLEVAFLVADEAQCDAEPRDRVGLHWIGLHHAARTKRLATGAARDGNHRKAVAILRTAIRRLGRYAKGDPELEQALSGLQALEADIKAGRLTANARREMRYQSMMSSRGQRDHRGRI